jgi:hypothetical protein
VQANFLCACGRGRASSPNRWAAYKMEAGLKGAGAEGHAAAAARGCARWAERCLRSVAMPAATPSLAFAQRVP